MGLNALSSSTAILDAVAEFDRLGRSAFLTKYWITRPARSHFLLHRGQHYDSKAIAGAAHAYQHPHLGPLAAADFGGGEATVARLLRGLGFAVERIATANGFPPALEINRVYSWDEMGEAFGFKPSYLGAAGGYDFAPDLRLTPPRHPPRWW